MVLIEDSSDAVEADASSSDGTAAHWLPDTVADSKLGASFDEAASWFDEEPDTLPPPAESSNPGQLADDTAGKAEGGEADTTGTAAAATPLPPPLPDAREQTVEETAAAHATPPIAPPPPAEQFAAAPAEAPLLPGDHWMSPTTQNIKRIALVAGAGLLGVLGVIGLAIAVTAGGDSSKSPAVPSPEVAVNPAPPVENAVPAEPPSPAAAPDKNTSPPDVPPTVPEPPVEPTAQEHAPASVAISPAAPAAPLAVPPEPDPVAPTEPEPPLFEADPPAPPPAGANPSLAALDSLLPLLEGAPPKVVPEPTRPAESPAPNEPPAAGSDDGSVAVSNEIGDFPPLKPEPRSIDLRARMNDPIESIEFPATPLVSFVRLMSDFSTIPITLDPVALDQLKISPSDEISLVMGKTTVGEVLTHAASMRNLLVEKAEGQLIITHNRDASRALRQAKYSVTDLIGTSSPELDHIKNMVLAQIAPGTWQETGGVGEMEIVPGALLVRHVEPVHHQLVLFFEKLRLARGKPLRSSYHPHLFDTAARVRAFEPKLQEPISLNYFEPTRLRAIVERLERLTDVQILIDWQALLAQGWTPDTEVTLSVAEGTFAEALDQMLSPREWTFRVINQQLIQITTPQALAACREVEFYPAGEVIIRNGWTAAELQAAILAQLPLEDDVVRPVLGYDETSGHVVVSASPLTHAKIVELLGDL